MGLTKKNTSSKFRLLLTGQLVKSKNIRGIILALYDETANSEKETDQKIAEKCLKLWDVMFEKQIGQVRDLSRELMER